MTNLINASNTEGDDLGPYTLFSAVDGFEYLLLSSESTNGDLDFYYLKNQPVNGVNPPAILDLPRETLLNTDSDDAYICFDTNQDSAYFSSGSDGNFDIYIKTRPLEMTISEWFDGNYSISAKVDSINSTGNDKCPYVFRKYMVFASEPSGRNGWLRSLLFAFQKG